MRTILAAAAFVVVVGTGILAAQAMRYPEGPWPLAMPQVGAPLPAAEPHGKARGTPSNAARDGGTPKNTPAAGSRRRGMAAATRGARPVQPRTDRRFGTLKPFTADTQFLSLPAYVRFSVHSRTGRWISYDDAIKILRAETAGIETMGR